MSSGVCGWRAFFALLVELGDHLTADEVPVNESG